MVTAARIKAYRRDGFVHVPNLIDAEEALRFRELALAASERLTAMDAGPIFRQTVNVWTQDEGSRP